MVGGCGAIGAPAPRDADGTGGHDGRDSRGIDHPPRLEDQADRVGLRYAYEGKFDVKKGPALWNRFAEKYGSQDAVTNFFFGDHSRAQVRAKNLTREIELNYR